ncbi:hypothetical protein IFM12276_20300 [Nocardia sputorum]|uniref:DNA ligase (ATP) n=1 Tax=Nocardia sputorum TaxID=2984338 RepID=A0ABM8CVK5_9NOCA|nr:hypothetical protein IFM12276_20300 [Nocardia sputorum]
MVEDGDPADDRGDHRRRVPRSSSGGGERGALILGVYDESNRLVYIGHVGTGFTMAARRALLAQLKALTTTDSPFDQSAPSWRMTAARWVKPQLVGTVEYREFIGVLRHPSWRGLRVEIVPSGVRLPTRDVPFPRA